MPISELNEDLKELEADFGGQTITWEGVEYVCIPSPVEESVEIEIGGNMAIVRAAVLVRDSIFPDSTPPEFGATITYRDRLYLVASARQGHGIHTLLTLADPNR